MGNGNKIFIVDISIDLTKDIRKIKELHKGEKPEHLTDEQWERAKKTGEQIIKNISNI
jgi:hypothetical protein